MRFGRYRVIERVPAIPGVKQKQAKWLCRCDCGKEKICYGSCLRSGHTSSCGCFRTDRIKVAKTTHGMRKSKEYVVWCNMISRCENPNNRNYKYYGGRGITVCPDFHSFECFIKSMGPRPLGCTIDRIDNNGNYEPSNCRWANEETQKNNRSDNVFITYKGETLTIAQWSKAINIPMITLWNRIKKCHWPIEKALTNPIMSHADSSRLGHIKRWGYVV